MKLGSLICAFVCAFCMGAATSSGLTHVFVMAAFWGILSLVLWYGHKADKKREEEEMKRRMSHE